MQSTLAVAQDQAAPPPQRARQQNVLLNLASPVLELVLKLKTGVIPASNDVRPVVQDLLRQLEESAPSYGVPYKQAQAVKFALVAFVDETVLHPSNNFPLRDEWEKNPLQLEHFSEHLAGEKFFDRLGVMLKNIAADADVVEVYYMCLLLGYKGKYNIYLLEEQLRQIIRSVAEHLRHVGRLRPNALSARWLAEDQPPPPVSPKLPIWVKIGGPALVAFVLVVYGVLYLLLNNDIHVAR
ncbi:MAG TPA: type IVB secretion system protein IcmH/DotU [Pyrinomonadaceae bacterium]|jgi:type VI secretion system protein ImpK